LITHWGMSGPAILKLSAFGARILADKKYDCVVSINWLNLPNESEIKLRVEQHLIAGGNKQISNVRISEIPQRLWDYLLTKIQVPLDKNCAHLNSKRSINWSIFCQMMPIRFQAKQLSRKSL
jgi:predicted flavoprotein YhiN